MCLLKRDYVNVILKAAKVLNIQLQATSREIFDCPLQMCTPRIYLLMSHEVLKAHQNHIYTVIVCSGSPRILSRSLYSIPVR